MLHNFVKYVLDRGGSIHSLLLPYSATSGSGVTNPSVFVDGNRVIANIRNVQYYMYHSEHNQKYSGHWGPLSYLHPEDDSTLRTTNFYAELDADLSVNKYCKINTSKFDVEPIWIFIGLEDARPVRWNDKLYICGVRRDTTTNGQGRMELSEIKQVGNEWCEVNRHRIEPYDNPDSYCEKNWMPVVDMPFHFVKWTNPTQVVKVNVGDNTSEEVFLSDKKHTVPRDLRGSSHVITVGNYRVAITHEVDLYYNRLNCKDSDYYHRFVVWDRDWNIVKITNEFSFMNTKIEFCCGAANTGKNILISFGYQDTLAYILKMPISVLESFLNEKH